MTSDSNESQLLKCTYEWSVMRITRVLMQRRKKLVRSLLESMQWNAVVCFKKWPVNGYTAVVQPNANKIYSWKIEIHIETSLTQDSVSIMCTNFPAPNPN